MTGSAILRLGGLLLRSGLGLFVLSLATELGLILHFFYVTPFEICSASFATTPLTEVWPWAVPLSGSQGTALALIAAGLWVIASATRRHDLRSELTKGRGCDAS
jgi:hypothetical protein